MRHCIAVLLAALTTSAAAVDKHGPGSWVEHGMIAGLLTYPASGTKYRWLVSGAVCAGFIAREMTQRGGAFNDLDSNMDWALPCAVSAGMSVFAIPMRDGAGIGAILHF